MKVVIKDNMFLIVGLFYILEDSDRYTFFLEKGNYVFHKPITKVKDDERWLIIRSHNRVFLQDVHNIFLQEYDDDNKDKIEYRDYIDIYLNKTNCKKLLKYFKV